ncbi:HAD family hydrolase [Microvirga antarctica]|uniref:HAD family hydrolase n=1 Tax=Microvirga antarctica TaxID=2819233 RepID=UPI001B30FD13|nr:HAD-IA family hydrolase [Microvirga antarctica]
MLLIFDCDGVLVDSEALACAVDAEVLTALGVPFTADEIAARFIGVSQKDMIARIEAERACTLPADFPDRLNRTLYARMETELRPIAGIREAIAALPFRRCVASSSLPERIAFSLRLTGLADLFEDIFSASEVAHGKPAPDLFLHAAAQMGFAPSACLVVEDSLAGIAAARAAGMAVIGFAGGGHCGPGHADRLRAAGAQYVIDAMANLPEAVSRLRAA